MTNDRGFKIIMTGDMGINKGHQHATWAFLKFDTVSYLGPPYLDPPLSHVSVTNLISALVEGRSIGHAEVSLHLATSVNERLAMLD